MSLWVEVAGQRRRVDLAANTVGDGPRSCTVDGIPIELDASMVEPGVLSIIVAGRQYRCTLDGDAVVIGGRRFPFALEDPRSLRGRRGVAEGVVGPRTVKAPMPGRVVRVLVAEGDDVAEQQGVVVIEAMKMQNELKSPRAGRVVKIAIAVDDTVGSGDVLVVIE